MIKYVWFSRELGSKTCSGPTLQLLQCVNIWEGFFSYEVVGCMISDTENTFSLRNANFNSYIVAVCTSASSWERFSLEGEWLIMPPISMAREMATSELNT